MTPQERARLAARAIAESKQARREYLASEVMRAMLARLARDPSAICELIDLQRALAARDAIASEA